MRVLLPRSHQSIARLRWCHASVLSFPGNLASYSVPEEKVRKERHGNKGTEATKKRWTIQGYMYLPSIF